MTKSKLPPSVVRDKQRGVYLREYLGRVEGKRKYGPRVHLCPYDSPVSLIWRRYEEIQIAPALTVAWLFRVFFQSRDYQELRPKTQLSYDDSARVFMRQQSDSGTCVRDLQLKHLTERSLRQYLDTYPYKVAANRQLAVLSSAWSWAKQRYDVPDNPCLSVKPNKEKPRTRYVSDEEYASALERASPWLRVAMELSYLCRARAGEVYGLRREDVTSEGLLIRRGKGSDSELTAYHPRLVEALDMAEALPGQGETLVRSASGRITKPAHASAWRRCMAKENNPFTFHDLKAKGLTDMAQVQTPWAGHKSEKMLGVYIRKPKIVEIKYGLTKDS